MTQTNKRLTPEEAYNELLGKISSNQPLALFPLRLETHFREGRFPVAPLPGEDVTSGRVPTEYRRELCVRIFPDE